MSFYVYVDPRGKLSLWREERLTVWGPIIWRFVLNGDVWEPSQRTPRQLGLIKLGEL